MKKKFIIFYLIIILIVTIGLSQSLVDIAKRERERRKKIKKKVPVITNETVGKIKKGKGYGFIIGKSSGDGSFSNSEYSEIPEKQKYEEWGKKYKRLMAEIKAAEELFRKEKKELDDLIFRFKITNNPNEKFALPHEISKKEKEVAKLNERVKKLKKDLENFKERARREGIPPGYLR